MKQFMPRRHQCAFALIGTGILLVTLAFGATASDDAQFVDQQIPVAEMQTEERNAVSITMRNTGTDTWTSTSGHCLNAQNATDNWKWGVYHMLLWAGRVCLDSGETTAPGETKTFTFRVKAPEDTGTYNFEWQMAKGSQEFGESTPAVQVPIVTPHFRIKGITELEHNGGRVDWSVSGNNLIAYDRLGRDAYDDKSLDGCHDVWTTTPDGADQTCLTCGAPGFANRHLGNPTWHPSGDYIVIQAEYEHLGDCAELSLPGRGASSELWAMTSDGQDYYRLTFVTEQIGKGVLHPHFSADGRSLSWSELYQVNGQLGLWKLKTADFVVGADGPQLVNEREYLPGDEGFYENHGFSPDGSKLIFSTDIDIENGGTIDGARTNIYSLDLPNGDATPLTSVEDGGFHNEHSIYSPDGDRIVWMNGADNFNQGTDLWIMRSDGNSKWRLTHFNQDGYPEFVGAGQPELTIADSSWSPDGLSIVTYGLYDKNAQEGGVYLIEMTTADSPVPEPFAPPLHLYLKQLAVELHWVSGSDEPVPLYRVHYGTESGQYDSMLETAVDHAAVDDLTPGETYYFAVQACNDSGSICGDFSHELSATISYPEPQAAFSADVLSGSAPVPVQFTDESTGSVESWEWDFGDGTRSTDQHPQHTYEEEGIYTVRLTASGKGGASTLVKADYISIAPPVPVANFTANPVSGSAPLLVTFTDTSSGEITERSWDFGDGGSSEASVALYTYDTPGVYSVTLTVVGPGGSDEKRVVDMIEVVDRTPLVADFSADVRSGPTPLHVQFQDDSVGQITTWLWDFGDGGTSPQSEPDHVYTEAGTYDVSLTITGPDGVDEVTKTGFIRVGETELTIEVGEIEVGTEPRQVVFEKTFVDPVVIAKPLSANQTAPAVVRITEVDSDGFMVALQEWDYLDGAHATETLSFVAVERGRHRLPNGALLEAGRIATDATGDFERAEFSAPFESVPIVLAAITSNAEADAVVARIGNIDTAGFDIGMQEQERNVQAHAEESIDFVALEPSSGVVGELRFEAARTADAVTHRPFGIGFATPFAAPPAFVADIQTIDELDTANLRWRNKSAAEIEVWVDEESSDDWEGWHANEVVGYIAFEASNPESDPDGDSLSTGEEANLYRTDPFEPDTDGDGLEDGDEVMFWGARWAADIDGDGVSNILDTDADGDGFSDGTEVDLGFDPGDPDDHPGGALPFLAGEITLDDQWTWVPFGRSFEDPIVVANPLSGNDADPAVVRISDVQGDGFYASVQEWDYLDGVHGEETLSYLVVENGRHQLPGGEWIEAGKIASDVTNGFERVSFSESFAAAPVVLTAVTTVSEVDAVTTQVRNVNGAGFDVGMREQEANIQVHLIETMHYVAWPVSSGKVDGLRYEVGRTGNVVKYKPTAFSFPTPFDLPPILLADMQTTNNGNPASLRCQGKTRSAVEVWVDEEQSKDNETWHPREDVGYILIGH